MVLRLGAKAHWLGGIDRVLHSSTPTTIHTTHNSRTLSITLFPPFQIPVNNGINSLDTKLRATAVGPLGRERARQAPAPPTRLPAASFDSWAKVN